MIVAAKPFEGHRLRVRRIDEIAFAEHVGRRAREGDEWVVDVTCGGNVANAYGRPAESECCLAIADPCGLVVYWTARASANKITERGTAEACFTTAGDLFDGRLKDKERLDFALENLKEAHRKEIPPLVVLALSSQ